MTIYAIGARTNNAQLMADCAALGYLPEPVFDATYGFGAFWSEYQPDNFVTNDMYCPANWNLDFTDLPFDDRTFGAVVFDPPYKLNGTSTGKGPSALDAGYGVGGGYVPIGDRHDLMVAGAEECARVCDETLLMKCQDQVSSGRVWWQTRMMTDAGHRCGFELVDMLHVKGCREQPAGRQQIHARRDYSTLLVMRRRSS